MKREMNRSYDGKRALCLLLSVLLPGLAGCKKTEVTLKPEEAAEQPAKASWWEGYTTIAIDPAEGRYAHGHCPGAQSGRLKSGPRPPRRAWQSA